MTESTSAAPTTRLSARLREDTKDVHRAAERSGIMRGLLRGELSRDAYIALLTNLRAVYVGLEGALGKHASDPLIAPFHFAEIFRTSSLDADLRALGGDVSCVTPAGEAYAAHVANASPLQLIAHAYVRYLGDLSGGQILKRVIGKALGSSDGLSFYDFPGIADLDAYKNDFRAKLDGLSLTDADVQRVVDEARSGFEMNMRVFDSIV